jgi:CRISPR-associated endonuclease/helicase Cas3
MKGWPVGAWGKFSEEHQEWHPLLHHCIDVGACLEALLGVSTLRRRLARLAGLRDLSSVQASCLAGFASLHDLGKVNNGFRRKIETKASIKAGHVREMVSLLRDRVFRKRTFEALHFLRMAAWCGSEQNALEYLLAILAHHGRTPEPTEYPDPRLWSAENAYDPFEEMSKLASEIYRCFPSPPSPPGPSDVLPSNPEFHHAFSGLVMLADWLASDTRFFPFSNSLEEDRLSFARERAEMALRRMGFDVTAVREILRVHFPSFRETFPNIGNPRPLQVLAESMDLPEDGSAVIFEGETGSGKTEAAFRYFMRLFHAGKVDGFYFALPTRSAALQIFDRLHQAAKHAFRNEMPPLILAVPGYLRFDDQEGEILPHFRVLWPDEGRDAARGWAAEHPKRYMAATLVVGTVDQALLSALRVSHAELRASALLRHLLIVDEVHASDTYMSVILREVLRHHLSAGGHALLMSATLGSSARHQLLSVDAENSSDSLQAAEIAYPAVWVASRGQSPRLLPASRSGILKSVSMQTSAIIDSPAQIAVLALSEAAQGGRVLVLRNRVDDAIATQRALEDACGNRDDLLFHVRGVRTLHHSRFAPADRKLLDREVDRLFGRPGISSGCVLISTQTVEQSLDVDFDLLITDLCPADVLLQRIGRLHRHADRVRAPRFVEGRAIVLVSKDRRLDSFIVDAGERHGLAKGPHGWGTVYPDLRMLEATWRLLESNPRWDLPNMNRLIVENVTHPSHLRRITSELGGRWEKHRERMEGIRAAHRKFAQNNLISRNDSFNDTSGLPSPMLETTIRTRLGLDDRVIEFDQPLEGPFGNPITALIIPGWMTDLQPREKLSPSDIRAAGGEIIFTLGSRTLRYDRLGLRGDHSNEPSE